MPVMSTEETPRPNPPAVTPPADVQETAPAAEANTDNAGLLSNHKGKLAVGAAAMLGLAIYYKWRENKLAKTDPEEYARLRRLKAVVGTDEEPAPKPKGAHKQGTAK